MILSRKSRKVITKPHMDKTWIKAHVIITTFHSPFTEIQIGTDQKRECLFLEHLLDVTRFTLSTVWKLSPCLAREGISWKVISSVLRTWHAFTQLYQEENHFKTFIKDINIMSRNLACYTFKFVSFVQTVKKMIRVNFSLTFVNIRSCIVCVSKDPLLIVQKNKKYCKEDKPVLWFTKTYHRHHHCYF